MRRHPELTVRILERVSAFRDLAATAGAHHERLDGRGYHLGLRAEQLNRDARILAVADVCEALTADRPYRDAMDPDQVREIMRGDAGTAFCHDALGALEETRELGPVGLATPVTACSAARRLADHLEPHVERAQREQPLDRAAAAHDDEPAPVAAGPALDREHAPEPRRVEEVQLAQVEDDAGPASATRAGASPRRTCTRARSRARRSATTQTVSGARLSMVIPSG